MGKMFNARVTHLASQYVHRLRVGLVVAMILIFLSFFVSASKAEEVSRQQFINSLQEDLRQARSLIDGKALREVSRVANVRNTGESVLYQLTAITNPDGTSYGTLEADGQTFKLACLSQKQCFVSRKVSWQRVPNRLLQNAVTPYLINRDPVEGFEAYSFDKTGRTYTAIGKRGRLVVTIDTSGVFVDSQIDTGNELIAARANLSYVSAKSVACTKKPMVKCSVK